LKSIFAQAALVTIAEHLVSPAEVQKFVTKEISHSNGSTENVGIRALESALKHATNNQEDILDIVKKLQIKENEIKEQVAKITSLANNLKGNVVS